MIETLSLKFNVEGRVLYVHDLHLPTLLTNARGCVVINSTVGLSALYHNCPLKVVGRAFYDIDGLTYQGNLHSFGKNAAHINQAQDCIQDLEVTLFGKRKSMEAFMWVFKG